MAFSLADALKGVSEVDTGREQIEYIRLNLIDSDANNFYQLSEIEGLADNIALCGLQQPIRVRRSKDDPQRYTIVSGHRRRAAIELLAKDDPEKWQEAACIVEQDAVSPALQQLRLIYANSSTRKLTPAEISEQAVQVEKLLYQLKEEEGYEFPGRMRDHVAQACKISKTKLARLKVIRDDLDKCWQKAFKKGDLNESVAYALARMPADDQRLIHDAKMKRDGHLSWMTEHDVSEKKDNFSKIAKLKCKEDGGLCENIEKKRIQVVQNETWSNPCPKCCRDCPKLISCKNSCPKLADLVAERKKERKEENRQAKLAKEENDRPDIEQLRSLWGRFAECRKASGLSVRELFMATDRYWSASREKSMHEREDPSFAMTASTNTPFDYDLYLAGLRRVIKTADAFHVSLDYLFCRTDYPELVKEAPEPQVSKVDTAWQTGEPPEIKFYAVVSQYDDCSSPDLHKMLWTGYGWKVGNYEYNPDTDGVILGWMPLPEEVSSNAAG